jgi:hypothetical protein
MSQKDFTNWNGRKHKAIIRPPKERPIGRAGKRKNPGFKTKVDRYKSVLIDLATDWCRYQKWIREGQKGCFGKWSKEGCQRQLKEARKMKEVFIAEGIYDKVLESVGTFKFRDHKKWYF